LFEPPFVTDPAIRYRKPSTEQVTLSDYAI
jgi:hypothetical protein